MYIFIQCIVSAFHSKAGRQALTTLRWPFVIMQRPLLVEGKLGEVVDFLFIPQLILMFALMCNEYHTRCEYQNDMQCLIFVWYLKVNPPSRKPRFTC